jgi:GNAT superfamily N-acetyltransferase
MSLSLEAGSLSVPAAVPASSAEAASAELPRYSYRCLASAELPLLNDLYNEHYRCQRPLAEAEWLYTRNPNGQALIYAAFDAAGQLAGMRPAIPFKLCWRGQERTAYEFADALVSARHQGRGIFSQLVKLICEHSERDDFTLYSLPNENSLPVYRRSRKLQVLGASETRVRPISWRDYFKQRMGLNGHAHPAVPAGAWHTGAADDTVSLVPVDRFESDFEDVHAELGARVASFTQRSRAFLQWRYFGSPVREYRVALVRQHGRVRGYVVVRMLERVAHLVDVFVSPEMPLACRVLELATQWAGRMGATAVHFNASRRNFFHSAAARSGFWLSKRSGSLVLDRRSGDLLESRQCGPLEPPDVYFVMGDFDFF